MAVTFVCRLNTKDTERAIAQLKMQAPACIARALNRAGTSAKVLMARVISQDTGLKVGTVKDAIGIMEAKAPFRLAVQLTASARPIPLIDYGAKGPEPSRGRGRGVAARLKGGAGRYPQAFIATMRSGHRGVFQRGAGRVGLRSLTAHTRRTEAGGPASARLPIYELHGPSIAHIFEKHVDVGLKRGEEQLVKNLQSEFRYALRNAG